MDTHTNHEEKITSALGKRAYVEIIDFAGPPINGQGRIHVQVAVWKDKEMTELVDLHECFSLGSLNKVMDKVMEAYA